MIGFNDYLALQAKQLADSEIQGQEQVPVDQQEPEVEIQQTPTIGGTHTLGLAQPQTLGMQANR